jgi:multicomponent Na+:H+ antiporter subunit E
MIAPLHADRRPNSGGRRLGHNKGAGKAARQAAKGRPVLRHAISLSLALFVVWLLLSGHYEPLTTSLGVISCVFVAWVAHRMDVVDREGHPIHLTWRAAFYWPWLFWEIVKSNIDVARIILDPRLPIRPQVIWIKASQVDDLGYTIYGNSITLTPGTVTIDVVDNNLEVHALADIFAEGLRSGEMDRRVTHMEGRLNGPADRGA